MSKFKYSVVVPFYNKEPKIVKRCLDSFKNQDRKDLLKDLEIVFMDDCSTDELSHEALELIKQYPELHVKYHKGNHNLGLFLNRLNGLRASTGDWVFCLDVDDEWRHEFLQQLDNIITKKAIPGNYDLVTFGVSYYHAAKDKQFYENALELTVPQYESFRECLKGGKSVFDHSMTNKAFSRGFLNKLLELIPTEYDNDEALNHLNYCEDMVYFTVYYKLNPKYCTLNRLPYLYYYEEEGSMMASMNTDTVAADSQVNKMADAIRCFRDHGTYEPDDFLGSMVYKNFELSGRCCGKTYSKEFIEDILGFKFELYPMKDCILVCTDHHGLPLDPKDKDKFNYEF